MDFSVPPPLASWLSEVRDFIEQELYPIEANGSQRSFAELLPELEAKRQLVKDKGWWAPQVPRDRGGAGLGFWEHALLSQEMGRSPYGHFVFNAQAPDAGNIEVLLEYGSETQQQQWLVPLIDGSIRSCFSMTEPDRPGSNPVWMETRAERDGDHYVINGHKWFTTAADGATFAIVMAITDPQAPPHRRASQFIVPTETDGFERVRNISCMGHAGDGWLSHAEIRYRDCQIPVHYRIGQEGDGFAIAQSRLGPGRIHHCMRWLGISERSLDLMCHHLARRDITPDQKLSEFQTAQNWVADSRAEIDAARWMTLHAAWKIDQVGTKAARVEISAIKFFVADVMLRVIDRAIQAHGALGISDDTVLATFYRNERSARIYDGPDEVHRRVVAREVMKAYT